MASTVFQTCLLHLSPTIRLLQPLRSGRRSSVLLAAGAACCGQVMRQHHSSLLALLLSSNPDAATTDAPLLGTLEADTSPLHLHASDHPVPVRGGSRDPGSSPVR